MRVYLDMDGVCCDFVGGVLRLFGKSKLISSWPKGRYDVAGVMGVTEKQLWRKIDDAGDEFWRNLQEHVWFKPLYAALKKRADEGVFFLTSPSKHESSMTGKARWLRDRLGAGFDGFVFTRHKDLLANRGCVLIDDDSRNAAKFTKAGGFGLLFPRPWNDAEEPLNLVSYALERLERR